MIYGCVVKQLLSGLFQIIIIFKIRCYMLRWQCSHTFIVPDNGKMECKVYNIDRDMCFSVWLHLSFFLFHSLAHYVEAATNRLGFQSPKLSSNQAEMPRTRFVTNLVRLLQLLILHKSYMYYVTIFFLHRYHRSQGFESHACLNFFFQALFSQLQKLCL